jgi:hypothetical protein
MNTTIHLYNIYPPSTLPDILLISFLVPNLVSFFGLVTTPIILAINNKFFPRSNYAKELHHEYNVDYDEEEQSEEEEHEGNEEGEKHGEEGNEEGEEEGNEGEEEQSEGEEEQSEGEEEESSSDDDVFIPKVARKSFTSFANDLLSYINSKSKNLENMISNNEFKKYNSELVSESKKMINMILNNSSYEDILKAQNNIQSLVQSVGKFINEVNTSSTPKMSTTQEQESSTLTGDVTTQESSTLTGDVTTQEGSETDDLSKQNMRFGN